MGTKLFNRIIFVAVVEDWSIVRTKNDQRVFGEPEPFDGLCQFTHTPVELQDAITARAKFGFSLESFVRDTRNMDVLRGEEEEERPILVGFDPAIGFGNPLVGYIFVAKPSFVSTGVKSDPADSIVYGLIVSMGPVHLQRASMGDTRGMVFRWFVVPNP